MLHIRQKWLRKDKGGCRDADASKNKNHAKVLQLTDMKGLIFLFLQHDWKDGGMAFFIFKMKGKSPYPIIHP